ncbi:hypothetical protein GF326_04790 [Candidatus Bathyarchaeota archaeon]|nr:hypothetical protein [Candidatus Bathyarchaeota archaeon]
MYGASDTIFTKLKKILLTGYEPFLDFERNPSIKACRVIEDNTYNGYKVIVEELPMKYKEIRNLVEHHIDDHQPSAVIATGVSSMAPDICVERVAINIGSADGGPNFGFDKLDQVLNPDGPAAYESTLPIRDIVDEITAVGIPARISNSAGTQGCNLVFYHLLDYLDSKDLGTPAGFIHVPRLPENAIGSRNPSMNLIDSAKALEVAVKVTASRL